MGKVLKTKQEKSASKQITEYQEPQRLSKAGQWWLDHPEGIVTVIDRKAVNR